MDNIQFFSKPQFLIFLIPSPLNVKYNCIFSKKHAVSIFKNNLYFCIYWKANLFIPLYLVRMFLALFDSNAKSLFNNVMGNKLLKVDIFLDFLWLYLYFNIH